MVTHGLGRGLAGVTELYALASDGLRSKLGALQVFERAFGNDLYLPLLQHDELRAGPPVVIGGSARAELIAVRSGEVATFQLGMVRNRRGPHEGLWSLSGVFREGVDL